MITDTAESLKWRVVERFYLAWNNFQSVHDRYEQIVHDYVDKLGVPREKIRLDPKDLFELLSTQDLEVLRDDFLTPLKTACHRLFRTEDSTDFLDRLVNDIFHELSILKEEHYNVLTYATDEAAMLPGTDRDLHQEQQVILDEVHDMFPQRFTASRICLRPVRWLWKRSCIAGVPIRFWSDPCFCREKASCPRHTSRGSIAFTN